MDRRSRSADADHRWKPGQTIEYTRTVFVPVYPYVGEATIQVGLYGQPNEPRVPLAGEDVGQRAYRVARLQLAPQSETVFSVFKDGWHPAEAAEHNAMVEWHWTKKVATLAVRNPKRDCMLYLDLDNPGGVFDEPQQVTVSTGATQVLDQFTVTPKKAILRKIPMPATAMGADENVDVRIEVDKTFVPSRLSPTSKDPARIGRPGVPRRSRRTKPLGFWYNRSTRENPAIAALGGDLCPGWPHRPRQSSPTSRAATACRSRRTGRTAIRSC